MTRDGVRLSRAHGMSARAVAAVRRRLLAYYDAHARDLPWRRTRNPYRIWISEVMLQQTRVSVAAERYASFLARFPNVAHLARASAVEVCQAWAGLGYYGRACNLHAAAREIHHAFSGRIPKRASDLRRLPGFGRYTAGAVASIAFGEREPALDTNAERVLARVVAAAAGARAASVRELAQELVDCDRPGDLNQALMDLGAQVCSAHTPACRKCPLARLCRANACKKPEAFPAQRRRTRTRELDMAFAWLQTPSGVWLERRPLGGLWSALWQLPAETGPSARRRLEVRLGIELRDARARVHHSLTHRRLHATVYTAEHARRLRATETLRPYLDPLTAPLSAVARKAIVAAGTAPLFRSGR